MRAVAPFQPHERLFRSLSAADIDGLAVRPTAVDLQGTSVCREAYVHSIIECILVGHVGLGAVTEPQLPVAIVVGDLAAGSVYEFFAFDCPEEGNEAHAEIRTRPKGSPSTDNKAPKSRASRAKLRDELANRMQVVHPSVEGEGANQP